MDTNTMIVLVIALFAVIVLAAFIIYRQRARVNIKGPGGLGLGLDAYNDKQPSAPGIQMEDAKAVKGSVRASNEMGDGVAMRRVEAGQDIEATNKQPKGDNRPKEKRR